MGTKTTVLRESPPTGATFVVYQNALTQLTQALVMADTEGNQVGVSGGEIHVQGSVLDAIRTAVEALDNAVSGTTIRIALVPQTSGGWAIYRTLNANSTGQNVKASGGQVGGWFVSNSGSAPAYLKIYNKATAPSSADTPIMTAMLPAGAAANVEWAQGIALSNGIGIRATTGVSDGDTGNPGSNEVVVNLLYK